MASIYSIAVQNGFLHIWLFLHLWICFLLFNTNISNTHDILWQVVQLSSYKEHLLVLLNQGLGSFPCGPSALLWAEQTNFCLFFSCHSWFYRPSSQPPQTSLSRMNFEVQLSQSFLIWKGACVYDHSCFACLNLTHFYSVLWAGRQQEWLNQDVQGQLWISKGHYKILCFVLYLFLSNIHCLFYLFHCCLTQLLDLHGTIHQNGKMLLITESPVFHMGS